MGIIRRIESKTAEIEQLRKLLLQTGDYKTIEKQQPRQEDEAIGSKVFKKKVNEGDDEEENKLVCVTSGVSYLGVAIVNHLLNRGYSVRIAVDNQEDMEKLIEQTEGRHSDRVMVKISDIESLCKAFHGCCGVFHTSAFVDPAGISGYTKIMAELEVKGSENVIEACTRTESVRKCVFTSSLLACVWHHHDTNLIPCVVDHNYWSEESVCRDKKLWFALGKTMAERAAWRIAEDSELKLATICPAFLTGSEFFIPYLKGAQEMYAEGVLATTDVNKVAEAHVCVYEALRNTASGRYICFDRVIQTDEEVLELTGQRISRNSLTVTHPKLCNKKLLRLMSSRQSRCS